jgi:hypothetical protein
MAIKLKIKEYIYFLKFKSQAKSKDKNDSYHVVGEVDEDFSRKSKALNGVKKGAIDEELEEGDHKMMFLDKLKKSKAISQAVDPNYDCNSNRLKEVTHWQ